jgi:hypothetical protein
MVNNCTISGNSATSGGGMYGGTVNNSIVWYNEALNGNDLYSSTARYSCSPDVTAGANGNITNAPVMLTLSRIAADSPCRGTGSPDYTAGTDIDGEAWLNPPSMGCDEPMGGEGPLSVSFVCDQTRVPVSVPVAIHGDVEGVGALAMESPSATRSGPIMFGTLREAMMLC